MIQSIVETGTMAPNTQVLGPANDAKGKKSLEPQAAGYRVSFNREVVSALTYDRTGEVSFQTGENEAPSFENLLSRLLERQGVTYEEALGGKTVEIDPETRAEAQELISENGYWGVNKTSERIFEFAIAGAGGDPAKLEEIKAAIDKGFDMAAQVLGGSLPEISSETYDAVIEKLDEWADDKD